jgi:hypothetical protein
MNGTVHALQPLQPLQPLQSLYRDERPERAEVEAAIRTIIRWAGDDPEREGLIETPARVVRALEEFFCGYGEDPAAILQKSFEEIDGYDEMEVLRDVRFESTTSRPSSGRLASPTFRAAVSSASASSPAWCRHSPGACRFKKS